MANILFQNVEISQIPIRFSYSPELVRKIKEIKEQSWHPDAKCWTVSNNEPIIELLNVVFSK